VYFAAVKCNFILKLIHFFLKSPHKFEVLPDSKFTIKRSAYKDNSSEYFVDNRKVQYKEIQQLLIGCGVDLDHNRFLILQV
jgi:structural maintenance of chromosome 4